MVLIRRPKVHPGDVIIAAAELAWNYGQRTGHPASALARQVARSMEGERRPLADRLTEAGFLLPGRLRTH